MVLIIKMSSIPATPSFEPDLYGDETKKKWKSAKLTLRAWIWLNLYGCQAVLKKVIYSILLFHLHENQAQIIELHGWDLWLPWFSVKNNTSISICNTLCLLCFTFVVKKHTVTLNLDYELYFCFKYISKAPCWFNSWLTELCIYAFKNSAITITLSPAKGQLISKCLFGIFNSSKKIRSNYYVAQVELFSIVFWKKSRHQKDISKLTDLYVMNPNTTNYATNFSETMRSVFKRELSYIIWSSGFLIMPQNFT